MIARKTTAGIIVLMAVTAAGLLLYQYAKIQNLDTRLRSTDADNQKLRVQLSELEQRLSRADAGLSAATRRVNVSTPATRDPGSPPANTRTELTPQPITKREVETRYKNAQALAAGGHHAEALEEFLWCYDEGMLRVAAFTGVRQSFLLSAISKLGEKHPPALAALRDRRDQAQQQLAASGNDFDAAMSFSSLNRVLKEPERTLQYYDAIPIDDPAKQQFSRLVYDQLAEARRYSDAARAKPFKQMLSLFEAITEPPVSLTPQQALLSNDAERRHAVRVGAGFVEVLAGAGYVQDARDLAAIITAYDSSPEAIAVLRNHAARAGHPRLFSGPTSSP